MVAGGKGRRAATRGPGWCAGLLAVQSAEAGKATGSHDVPSKLAKEGWLVLVGVLSEAKNWARNGLLCKENEQAVGPCGRKGSRPGLLGL